MSWFSDLNKKEKSTFISAFGGAGPWTLWTS